MRVLLQNTETKLYFIDSDKWTDDPLQATDFEEVEMAAEVYHRNDLDYARIVVQSALLPSTQFTPPDRRKRPESARQPA